MAACGDDEDSTAPEWLFVQSSDTATMVSSTSLEMHVGENPFAFTDRPDRRHVFLTPAEFIALWNGGTDGGFADDPPNAVVTWLDVGDPGEGVLNEAEVVVTEAAYSEDTEAITYTVSTEEGEIPVGALTHVSLFIDDAPLTTPSGAPIIQCESFGDCPPPCNNPWISQNFDCVLPSGQQLQLP